MKGVKLTQEEFITKAKLRHGEKYDYSKVLYSNMYKKVCIKCMIHGEFWQRPLDHLNGSNCPECVRESYKKTICGFGVNDLNEIVFQGNVSYNYWRAMIERCYSKKVHKRSPTYIGCSVCNEWKYFSKFKEWFVKHYKEGWQIDKDILVKGNKLYSPETCCFVPHEINSLFTSSKRFRGTNPIGVVEVKTDGRPRYASSVRTLDKRIRKYFDNKEDAFQFYKKEKENNIKRVAVKWKDQLEPNVYEALYNYKVEITD